MPTDETTLEALAVKWEGRAKLWATKSGDQWEQGAAEARLIADALRCKLASLRPSRLSDEEA